MISKWLKRLFDTSNAPLPIGENPPPPVSASNRPDPPPGPPPRLYRGGRRLNGDLPPIQQCGRVKRQGVKAAPRVFEVSDLVAKKRLANYNIGLLGRELLSLQYTATHPFKWEVYHYKYRKWVPMAWHLGTPHSVVDYVMDEISLEGVPPLHFPDGHCQKPRFKVRAVC